MLQENGERTALVVGAICGITIGLMSGLQMTLAVLGADQTTLQLTGSVEILAGYVIFFIAGLVTRRRTRSVTSGVASGLVAGAGGGLAAAAANLALAALAPPLYLAASGQGTRGDVAMGDVVVAQAVTLVLDAGLGVGLALAGALAPLRERRTVDELHRNLLHPLPPALRTNGQGAGGAEGHPRGTPEQIY
jgi:hypothetical protein